MNTLILDATAKSITAVRASAKTTTDPDFTAHYADVTATSFAEGSNDGTLDGTTPVTIVAAPAASTRRIVKSITIKNRDTVPAIITLSYVSAGGTRHVWTRTLAVGSTATLGETYDTYGNLKAMGGYAAWVSTSAPAVTDDTSNGFTISSRWINTATGREWVCIDATVGAAVWLETTTPSRTCAFLASLTTSMTDVTGDGSAVQPVIYNTEILNDGSCYNSATGTFTAPKTGLYHLRAGVFIDNLAAGHTTLLFRMVTSNRYYTFYYIDPHLILRAGSDDVTLDGSCIADMDAADIAQVVVTVVGGSKVVDITNTVLCHFGGYLVTQR